MNPSRMPLQPEMEIAVKPSSELRVERLACLWLISCVVVFIACSWHWPLTSDASLMHYVVFLMRHGMQPYRNIIDMNLPGSYLMEGAAISAFGRDSIGCRLYDLTLLAVLLLLYGLLSGHTADCPLFSPLLSSS